jgi:hypothetical protein
VDPAGGEVLYLLLELLSPLEPGAGGKLVLSRPPEQRKRHVKKERGHKISDYPGSSLPPLVTSRCPYRAFGRH